MDRRLYVPTLLIMILSLRLPVLGVCGTDRIYERSWAVVVGIDRYQHWPQLQAAVADATAMAERLREMGFDRITFLKDQQATRDRILTEIGTRLSQETGPNDRVVIYFAGHGFTEELPTGEQVGYLIPADCPQSNFFTYAISMQQIRETFSRMRAKHIYYIIDSCFSGYGFTRSAGVSPSVRGYLQVVTEKRAVQMITAGRKGDLAHEQGGHGIFTLYLLKGLKGEADLNGDGLVTASELGAYVQPNVYQASGQKQLPQYGRLEGEGEVVFLVGEGPMAKDIKQRIGALEKEMSKLEAQRKDLEAKKELLLADIMRLDVEIKQVKEKRDHLEKELQELRSSLERPSTLTPAPKAKQGNYGIPQKADPTGPSGQVEEGIASKRFRDLGNGTVLDSATGLLWEKGGSSRPITYSGAILYIEELNRKRFGGYGDWRIPHMEELKSLILGDKRDGMLIDPVFETEVVSSWSSVYHIVGAQKHYMGLDFRDGTALSRSEHTPAYHIKAVRGLQKFPPAGR